MPKTILIIDNDENARTSLADVLEEEGYRVIEAADGREGLARALKEKPDLVLVDTIMPGMDGHEVCRQIKKVRDLPLKIIVYTAIMDAIDAVKARRMGADDYAVKASNPSYLLDAIKKLI